MMKIERDRSQGMWLLKSGNHVLYSGRRSPWDNPHIMRDAIHREHQLHHGSSSQQDGRARAR
jgi:hypothetical protein